MIIAIEGAPGVGKSTVSESLWQGAACVIPEVNRLFAKPIPGPHEWYYERQVARWEMAALASKFCGWMVDLETSSIESNVAAIQRGLSGAPTVDPRRVLDFMQEWLPAISASEVF